MDRAEDTDNERRERERDLKWECEGVRNATSTAEQRRAEDSTSE